MPLFEFFDPVVESVFLLLILSSNNFFFCCNVSCDGETEKPPFSDSAFGDGSAWDPGGPWEPQPHPRDPSGGLKDPQGLLETPTDSQGLPRGYQSSTWIPLPFRELLT